MIGRLPVLGRRVDLSSQSRPPAPFVVGVTRSGTTLLRLMLDSHPELTIPPETHFLPTIIKRAGRENPKPKYIHRTFVEQRRWNDFNLDSRELSKRLRRLEPLDATSALRCFYDLYAEGQGKTRWGDKTPGYQVRMRRIAKTLPEARFVHVIRDGRDVVLSQWSKSDRPTPTEDAAKRWQQRVRLARNLASKMPEVYMELRYEDLIDDPERELRRICDFISLDFRDEMLRYHEGAPARLSEIAKDLPARDGAHALDAEKRMAAHEMATTPPSRERLEVWRREMSAEDVATFEEVAGETLSDLGYSLSTR